MRCGGRGTRRGVAVSVRDRMFRSRGAQRAGEKEGRPRGAAAPPSPPNRWCWKKRASVLSRHRLGASRQQVASLGARTGGTGRRDPRDGRGGGHAIRRDREVFRCGGVGGALGSAEDPSGKGGHSDNGPGGGGRCRVGGRTGTTSRCRRRPGGRVTRPAKRWTAGRRRSMFAMDRPEPKAEEFGKGRPLKTIKKCFYSNY